MQGVQCALAHQVLWLGALGVGHGGHGLDGVIMEGKRLPALPMGPVQTLLEPPRWPDTQL